MQLNSCISFGMDELDGSERTLLSIYYVHIIALLKVAWDNGTVCSLVAAFAFSINSLLVKLLDGRVPTSEIVLVRSCISLALCFAAAHVAKIKPFFGHLRHMLLLLARGCFGAAAMQTYYLSLFMLPMADAVTLFFLSPTLTAVAAWLILKEELGLVAAGGVAVSLGGLVIQTQPPFIFGHGESWDNKRTLGTVFGIVSAVCAAGAFIAIRKIGRREPALVMSVWFHSTALVSSIVPLSIGYPSSAVWPGAVDAINLGSIAVTSFFGQMVLSRGFQLQSAAKASAINLTQVVWSYFFGLVFLHSSFSWLGALGSLLISAGAILVNFKRPPAKQDEPQHKVTNVMEEKSLEVRSPGENRSLDQPEHSPRNQPSETSEELQRNIVQDNDEIPLLGFSPEHIDSSRGSYSRDRGACGPHPLQDETVVERDSSTALSVAIKEISPGHTLEINAEPLPPAVSNSAPARSSV